MKTYRIKVTYIEYIHEESIDERIMDIIMEKHGMMDPDSFEYMDEYENELRRMEETRPATLDLKIECDKSELDQRIRSAISAATGWCFGAIRYEIVSEKENNHD